MNVTSYMFISGIKIRNTLHGHIMFCIVFERTITFCGFALWTYHVLLWFWFAYIRLQAVPSFLILILANCCLLRHDLKNRIRTCAWQCILVSSISSFSIVSPSHFLMFTSAICTTGYMIVVGPIPVTFARIFDTSATNATDCHHR